MFGGEGLFVTTLQGPGRVWLQGMPADRMIAEIARRVPSGGPGIGIPIGGGGGAAAGEATGDEAAAGAVGDDAVVGDGEEMVASTDAAIDADRQNTVASSGASEVDADSQSALFGDAVPEGSAQPAGTTNDNADEFGDDAAFANTSSSETTFTDDPSDFDTPPPEEKSFNDDGFFEDTTTTEGLGDSEAVQEEGGSILSTIWDFFTSDD